MAKDEKEKKKSRGIYDPYIDSTVNELYDQWKGLNTKEKTEETQVEIYNAMDIYYDTLKSHLGELHGTDKDGKPLKHVIKTDNDAKTTKKNAQQLLSKLALKHIERDFGKDVAQAYSENYEKIEGYIEQIFGERYDQVVNKITYDRNLLESDNMKQYFGALAQSENKNLRKSNRLEKHLSDTEHHEAFKDMANTEIKGTKQQFKKAVMPQQMFHTLKQYWRQGESLTNDQIKDSEHLTKYKKPKDQY